MSQPNFHKVEDFRYDPTQNGWWSIKTGYCYPEVRSVNSMVPKQWWPKTTSRDAKTGNLKETVIKPADYIADVGTGLVVDGSIWWPGEPRIVENWVVRENGTLIPQEHGRLFNTYRPPDRIPLGEPASDNLWIQHIKALWPAELDHNYFFDYCAHMLQRPEEKANSIVALSGEQGIGKDLALLPVKLAIGEWNVAEIGPNDLVAGFNPWVQSIMVVVNEMRPTKEEFHASSMYDEMKKLSVTPPETLGLSEKYMRLRYVKNMMRLFLTTNNVAAMYIDRNDRRLAILHSALKTDWQPQSYFEDLANWLKKDGGNLEIAQWLNQRDLSQFKPKSRPHKTEGWKATVDTWAPPEDALAKALDILKAPDAFFLHEVTSIFDLKDDVFNLMNFPRKLSHRAQQSGYYVIVFDPPMRFVGVQTLNLKRAFIKKELINSPKEYHAMLAVRGKMLADNIAIMGQRSA